MNAIDTFHHKTIIITKLQNCKWSWIHWHIWTWIILKVKTYVCSIICGGRCKIVLTLTLVKIEFHALIQSLSTNLQALKISSLTSTSKLVKLHSFFYFYNSPAHDCILSNVNVSEWLFLWVITLLHRPPHLHKMCVGQKEYSSAYRSRHDRPLILVYG